MEKSQHLSLSAKRIAELSMSTFCPRCFWITNKLELPYNYFPSVFSRLDLAAKSVSKTAIHEKMPLRWMDELPPIRNEIRVSSAKRFFVIDPRTGLRVTGVPDALFELEDRTYAIIDYKVSNVNESARSDNPVYRAQLSIYAFIAETLGYRPVNHLGLLYYEPMLVNGEIGMPKKYLKRHSFMLPFQAHYFPIAPDSNIHSYFERAKEILLMDKPPAGRAYCEDCRKLRELIAAVTG